MEGARVSTIRRPDGSTLTVTVPTTALDDKGWSSQQSPSWITEDSAARQPSASALRLLASVAAAGPPSCLASRHTFLLGAFG
jgi:hypothetical protein